MPKAPDTTEQIGTTEQFMATNIIMQPTASLIPYANNARTHSEAQIKQIAASIQSFGFTNPVLVDGQNGIIAGHGRILAAELLGITEVPTICLPHLTNTAKRAYVLADNRIAINSGWDMETLAIEVQRIIDDGRYDVENLGFDSAEVDEMLNSIINGQSNPPLTDPDDVPEVSTENTRSKRGDIWLCGEHRVMCGDSTDKSDVDVLMEHDLAQMIWTDPPYGVSYVGKTEEALTIQNDGAADITDMLDIAFGLMSQRAIAGAAVYVAGPSGPGVGLVFSQMMEKHFNYQEQLIWVKNSMVMGRRDYHYRHEPIFYGYTNGHTGRIGRLGITGWYGDHCQTTVLEFDRPTASLEHPTMKPVALVAYCLQNSSKVGSIVLDPFGGSGTTLIACEQTGRVCRTVELEPKYCDVIVARWQKITGLQAVNAITGVTFNDTPTTQEAPNAL